MNELRRLAGLPAVEADEVEPRLDTVKYVTTAVMAIEGARDPHATLRRQFPELSEEDVESWVERALNKLGFGTESPKVR